MREIESRIWANQALLLHDLSHPPPSPAAIWIRIWRILCTENPLSLAVTPQHPDFPPILAFLAATHPQFSPHLKYFLRILNVKFSPIFHGAFSFEISARALFRHFLRVNQLDTTFFSHDSSSPQHRPRNKLREKKKEIANFLFPRKKENHASCVKTRLLLLRSSSRRSLPVTGRGREFIMHLLLLFLHCCARDASVRPYTYAGCASAAERASTCGGGGVAVAGQVPVSNGKKVGQTTQTVHF